MAGVLGALVLGVAVAAQSAAPVADAAMEGDRPAVRALLQQGRDVNAAQGDGMTALHWAAMKNDAELAQMLVYAGANVKATTRLGANTPLVIAARNGSAGVVDVLLKAGADARTPDLDRHDAADARCGLGQRRGGEGADRRRRRGGRARAVDAADGADVRRRLHPRRGDEGAHRRRRRREGRDQGGEPVVADLARGGGGPPAAAAGPGRRPGPSGRRHARAAAGHAAADRADRQQRRAPRSGPGRRRRRAPVPLQRAGRLAGRTHAAPVRGAPGVDGGGRRAARRRRRRQPVERRRQEQPAAHRAGQRPLRHRHAPARQGRRSEPRGRERRRAALRGAERAVGAQGAVSAAARLPAAEDGLPARC